MTYGLADSEVLSELEDFATLPPWLVDVMTPGRVAQSLRRSVPEVASGAVELLEADVDRLRSKGDQWLVHCRVSTRVGGEPRDVVLTGQVVPPGRPAEPVDAAPGAAFGEPGWRTYLEELRLELEVEVADAALPALPWLVDPDLAAQFLQGVLRGAGHEDVVTGCVPNVARYKPGSRCTLVYDMTYAAGSGPDPLVVKTHQGDKGRVAWDAMRALWERPLASGDVVTLGEPLAYLPEERVLVQGPVPEDRTLKDLAREALRIAGGERLAELRTALSDTARALAALHTSGATYGRTATWRDELDEAREVLERLARTLPHIAEAAEPLLRRLEALDSKVAADPVVSAHHDFRPAQVLLNAGRIGFIDFDGACMAEPALDLGRFCGKLRDIGVSAHLDAGRPLEGEPFREHLRLVDELCEEFVAEYCAHAPLTPERVVLWETIDLLTAVLHTWTKVRIARVAPRLAVLRHALERADAGAGARPVPTGAAAPVG